MMLNYKHIIKPRLLSFALMFAAAMLPAADAFASAGDNDADRSFLFFGKKKAKKVSNDEPVAKQSDYDKLISESATIDNGLFNVIRDGEDYFFEIPISLMGKEMLIVNKLVKVQSELNEAGANRGINNSNMLVSFELDTINNKVKVREFRPLPDVDPNDAIARSVAENYISPIVAAFKVKTYNNDSSAVVIRVNDVYDGTKTSFNNIFSDINLGTSPNTDLSRIVTIKSFDNNIYAVSELTTKVTEPTGTVYITAEVGSSLVLLPEKPMTRRYATPRIGYFTDRALHYADRQSKVDRHFYINRWRLEPKAEDREAYLSGQLVEPEKPIVFWLDNSTPYQWRKYIKQGIEDWNSAFELAGFKNAIRAEQLPDTADVDLDDISYSVVNYAASTKSNAMGPSITDPRSGEILEADIMWWHNVIDILHDWIVIQTGAVDPRARTLNLPDDVIGEAMRFVACHEVGHSLGLRHNMMASAAIPTDSLRSPSYVAQLGGTSASIMDYARFNYVAQPGDGVNWLHPGIGPYDRLAIQYGYRWFDGEDPEKDHEILQRMLSAYDNDLYRYSEAQDVREAIDPRALSEDLGDDPVKSAGYGIANLKRVVPNIIEWSTNGLPGQDYDDASRLYYAAIGQWQRYIYHVLANVGGIYIDNTTIGDGRVTYRFVETDRQRAAVQFIIDEAFIQPSWLFDADVSNYTFLISNTPIGRMENSPNFVLKNMQSFFLWDLLSDNRLIRMYENEAMNGDKAFKGSEMMDMLHNAIFAKTIKGRDPDVRERSMQKNFVDALIIAASETQGVKDGVRRGIDADPSVLLFGNIPSSGCVCSLFGHDHNHDHGTDADRSYGERPAGSRTLNFYGTQGNRVSDAISLKRGELMRIRTLVQSRIPTASRESKYHYEDLLMRINTALGIAQPKK